jgi:hypothetical protein
MKSPAGNCAHSLEYVVANQQISIQSSVPGEPVWNHMGERVASSIGISV